MVREDCCFCGLFVKTSVKRHCSQYYYQDVMREAMKHREIVKVRGMDYEQLLAYAVEQSYSWEHLLVIEPEYHSLE